MGKIWFIFNFIFARRRVPQFWRALRAKISRYRIYTLVLSLLGSFIVGDFAFGGQEEQGSSWKYTKVFEINSEAVTLKEGDGYQLDFKALLGLQIKASESYFSRWSLGGRSYLQESEKVGSSRRTGPIFQVQQNLWKNNLFLVAEHFSYDERVELKYETKLGVFGGYYFDWSPLVAVDTYGEVFHIRELSEDGFLSDLSRLKNLLSAARVSFLLDSTALDADNQMKWSKKFAGLLEIYHKNSPQFWGSEYTEGRMGLRIQPRHFVSFKIYYPLISTRHDSSPNIEGQFNVFLLGGW